MGPWVQCGAWPLEPSGSAAAALCTCPMSTWPSIICRYQPRSGGHRNNQNDSLKRIFSCAAAESWEGMSLNPSLLLLTDSPHGSPLLLSKSPHTLGPAPAWAASPQIGMTTQKSGCLMAASLMGVFNKKGGFSILLRDVSMFSASTKPCPASHLLFPLISLTHSLELVLAQGHPCGFTTWTYTLSVNAHYHPLLFLSQEISCPLCKELAISVPWAASLRRISH